MFRLKPIVSLIKPMSQLVTSQVSVSRHTHNTTQYYLHTSACKNHIHDHFNKQPASQGTKGSKKVKNAAKRSKKVKVNDLIAAVADLDNTKESVYGALDAWVAEENEFPIGRVKSALITLERKHQWHKVVQLIKWMLSKGQGVTFATYGQLIRALDMDNRFEEANKLWVKKLSKDVQSVPWKVCDTMIFVYYRNKMWENVVKLFKDLESHGRKPQYWFVVQKVVESYERLGLVEEKDRIREKYASLFAKAQRGRYGRVSGKEVSNLKISGGPATKLVYDQGS